VHIVTPWSVCLLVLLSDLECSDNFEENTMADLVRTFSKIYGLAGARVGYGIVGPAARAKGLMDFADPLQQFTRAGLVAAIASLKDEGYVERTRLLIKAERDKLIECISQFGAETFFWGCHG
jgi:histidinol-phosphate/aromatic aminotransferase/cobyric acid decarboxylase-like protein